MKYKFRILQTGSIPLNFQGKINTALKHRATSTLVYREINNKIDKSFLLIVDPAWVLKSEMTKAEDRIKDLQITLKDINHLFLTHSHYDHRCGLKNLAKEKSNLMRMIHSKYLIESGINKIEIIQTPGHSYDSRALIIHSKKRTAIVGDAVINYEYLMQWGYYYPNQYKPNEISETRQTMKKLIENNDVIIPGHGSAISVDDNLRQKLRNFY